MVSTMPNTLWSALWSVLCPTLCGQHYGQYYAQHSVVSTMVCTMPNTLWSALWSVLCPTLCGQHYGQYYAQHSVVSTMVRNMFNNVVRTVCGALFFLCMILLVVISNYNTFLNRLPLIFFSVTVENLGECCTIVTRNSAVQDLSMIIINF